jgi:hypothetical protein
VFKVAVRQQLLKANRRNFSPVIPIPDILRMLPHCLDGIRDMGIRDIFSPGRVIIPYEIRQKSIPAYRREGITGKG